jgi:Flp pilus assembly protein TadB
MQCKNCGRESGTAILCSNCADRLNEKKPPRAKSDKTRTAALWFALLAAALFVVELIFQDLTQGLLLILAVVCAVICLLCAMFGKLQAIQERLDKLEQAMRNDRHEPPDINGDI